MIWPGEPSTANPISNWCRKLLAACKASEVKPGKGYSVRRTAQGTTLELDPVNARSVYIPVCLEDGRKVYVQVLIRGQIYDANDGTVSAPEITTGDVPDGAFVLE